MSNRTIASIIFFISLHTVKAQDFSYPDSLFRVVSAQIDYQTHLTIDNPYPIAIAAIMSCEGEYDDYVFSGPINIGKFASDSILIHTNNILKNIDIACPETCANNYNQKFIILFLYDHPNYLNLPKYDILSNRYFDLSTRNFVRYFQESTQYKIMPPILMEQANIRN